MNKRFILLDRDGTICEESEYLSDPGELKVIPNAVAGLVALRKLGFGLVIVTNQSGVGRGYLTLADMNAVNAELLRQLSNEGVQIDSIYSCPHSPHDGCSCRKPNTGLIETASTELGFYSADSIVIGDKEADIELGKAIGAVSILVLTGYGESELKKMTVEPDYVAADVGEAARVIERKSI